MIWEGLNRRPETVHIFCIPGKNEGYKQIAAIVFDTAGNEKGYENWYRALLKNVENGTVFKRSEIVFWRCRNCGYIHEGTEAYFEVKEG